MNADDIGDVFNFIWDRQPKNRDSPDERDFIGGGPGHHLDPGNSAARIQTKINPLLRKWRCH